MDRISVAPSVVSNGNYRSGTEESAGASGGGVGGSSRVTEPSSLLSNYGREGTSPKRKIQTQSSAETSGLGDSLQRMHTLSSTETSGYSETIPSPTAPKATAATAGFSGAAVTTASSAERVESGRVAKQEDVYELAAITVGDHVTATSTSTSGSSTASSTMTNSTKQQRASGGGGGKSRGKSTRAHSGDSSADGGSYFASDHSTPVASTDRRTSASLLATSGGYEGLYKLTDATTGGSRRKRRPPEYLAEFAPPLSSDEDTPKETASAANSVTDGGGSGAFLGVGTQSTWLEWSQDRRASFKRKLDSIDERQQELERNRVTTPVRKARKESLMFASMDTDDNVRMAQAPTGRRGAIGCGGETPQNAPVRTHRSKQPYAEKDVKLTVLQWRALVAFWEHNIFVRCRYGGIVVGCFAFVIGIASVAIQDWSRFEDHPCYGQSYSGLWLICSTMSPHGHNCTTLFDRDWQTGVIGLVIFTLAFALLAVALSFRGLITATLSRKIYFYHSAGEIYFICAIGCTCSLALYPIVIGLERRMAVHNYGLGYALCFGAAVLFLLASVGMCLDDIVRITSRWMNTCRDRRAANSRV